MTAVLLLQLFDNLRSLRFQLSLLILLLFFAANGLVYSARFDRESRETTRIRGANEEIYDGVTTVAEAVSPWYRTYSPALGTEFMAEGGTSWTYDSQWVTPRTGRTVWNNTARTTNNWMRRFEMVDWAVITRYAVSFLCIVLAYNAVSGEAETGTLRLTLAYPLSRGRFLMGKLLAHLVTVLVAAAVGATVSLLILALGGAVRLDTHLAAACGWFALGLTFFAALFLCLALGVSALARTSAAALVFLVTLWTLLMVLIPQSSYLVAAHVVEPLGPFWDELNGYRTEALAALEMQGLTPRPVDAARVDDYAVERRYARRLAEMEEGLDRIKARFDQQVFRQYDVARAVNLVSPGFAFQYALEALIGTGVERTRDFFRQGWVYRQTLRAFLRGRDAADPASPHLLFLTDYMSTAALDGSQIPRFIHRPGPRGDALAAGVVPMIALVLETALALLFALRAMGRTELTGR